MRSLKEMVSGGQKVRFSHYRDGQLWYKTECDFEFPVPLVRDIEEKDIADLELTVSSFSASDGEKAALRATISAVIMKLGAKVDAGIGTASFMAEDKAMLFMRYIRKHIEFVEKSKASSDEIEAPVEAPLKMKVVTL